MNPIVTFQNRVQSARNEFEAQSLGALDKFSYSAWLQFYEAKQDALQDFYEAKPEASILKEEEVWANLDHLEKKIERAQAERTSAREENGEPKHRGRRSVPIIWPEGKFTIPELAGSLGVSTTHVYLNLVEEQKAGRIKEVGAVRKEGQRGRATKQYQVVKPKK